MSKENLCWAAKENKCTILKEKIVINVVFSKRNVIILLTMISQ